MGIRQLRDTLTKTIREVRAGESIEITHDGEPVALLTPVVKDRVEWLIAAGLVAAPLRPLELPEPLPITGHMSASEALEEDRAGR
jgi:prevent-host-death family protein